VDLEDKARTKNGRSAKPGKCRCVPAGTGGASRIERRDPPELSSRAGFSGRVRDPPGGNYGGGWGVGGEDGKRRQT
jgi:hypothetical protein